MTNSAIASIQGSTTGASVTINGVSPGQTFAQARVSTATCSFIPQTQVTVVPQFNVAYTDYIPVDHINGPTSCTYGSTSVTKIYMGDANRNTYRATESIFFILDKQQSANFFQNTGQTRNYGYLSPKNGSTLSSLDEDGIANDCYLWNASGQAVPNFSDDVSYPYANQGQVHFSGSACNPLEMCATIDWDMRTVINTPNPQQPTAYVNYNHTCYPSHQIKVNGQVIYLYTPTSNSASYIFGCLALKSGKIIGQTSSVNVPSH